MNIKGLCKELNVSRATIYRRAQNAGITINRDDNGDLTPETVSMLGSLFDMASATAVADQDESSGKVVDQGANTSTAAVDQGSEETAGTTSSTASADTSTSSAMLDRLRELESECSRLTIERDAARREAEIWRDQAQQWQEQATRSDARFDRLLQAGANAENQSPTIAERLRRLFSRRGN